jgi:hypothetical protein
MALNGGGFGGSAIRAGRAFVELFLDDNMLTRGLAASQKRLEAFGRVTAGIGTRLFAAGAAGTAAFASVVEPLRDLGKMSDVAKAFGTTAEEASGLLGVLGQFGEFKENVEGLTQFSEKVRQAAEGAGEGAKLFDGLSVSAKELLALPIGEQFYRTLGAIRELPQALQIYKLSLVGGTDSMKQWLPLLAMSNDELRAQAKSFERSAEELDAAKAASVGLTGAGNALRRAWEEVGLALAPTVADLAGNVADAARQVGGFVAENRQVIVLAAAGAVGVVALGVGLIAAGSASSAAAAAVGLLSAGLSAAAAAAGLVLTPVGAITAGLAAGGAAWLAYSDKGQAAWREMSAEVADAREAITGAFEGIKDAVAGDDLMLAAEIGFAGLKQAWIDTLIAMRTPWQQFTEELKDFGQRSDKGSGAGRVFGEIGLGATKLVAGVAGHTNDVANTLDQMKAEDDRDAAADRKKNATALDDLKREGREAGQALKLLKEKAADAASTAAWDQIFEGIEKAARAAEEEMARVTDGIFAGIEQEARAKVPNVSGINDMLGDAAKLGFAGQTNAGSLAYGDDTMSKDLLAENKKQTDLLAKILDKEGPGGLTFGP